MNYVLNAMNTKFLLLTFIALIVVLPSTYAQIITISFDKTPNDLSIQKSKLRYNKTFAYSLMLDDAYRDAFTEVFPFFQGGKNSIGTTFTGLKYTDGCGNPVPFKAGIAWNSTNSSYIDVHTGNAPALLTWQEMYQLYQNGWDIYNHSLSHNASFDLSKPLTYQVYSDEITKNGEAILKNLGTKPVLSHFVVPAGDTSYYPAAKKTRFSLIFDQFFYLEGRNGLNVKNPRQFDNFLMYRHSLVDDSLTINDVVQTVANKSANDNPYWVVEFTHRVMQEKVIPGGLRFPTFQYKFQSIADKFGQKGLDNIWAAPAKEVTDYLFTRDLSTFSTIIDGNNIQLVFDLKKLPTNLRTKTLTLVVNSAANISNLSFDKGVAKVTYSKSGAKKLINIEFTDINTATEEEIQLQKELKIYPNPVNNYFNVMIPSEFRDKNSGSVEFMVRDLNGKVISQQTASKEEINYPVSIQTEDLSNGVYILNIVGSKMTLSTKFVKY